jgi:hypothetical protein
MSTIRAASELRLINQATPNPGGTMSPDQAQFEARIRAREAGPTPEQLIVNELIRAARKLSITAAPPAHIRPTVWSNPVDLSLAVVVPAAVGQYTNVLTFEVPAGYGARIEQYGVDVQDPAYTYDGSLLWAFTKNGQYLDMGMSHWGEQRGSTIYPRKTVIILDSQGNNRDILRMQVRRAVAAGAPQTVVMNFRGWAWRKRNAFEGTQSSVTAY